VTTQSQQLGGKLHSLEVSVEQIGQREQAGHRIDAKTVEVSQAAPSQLPSRGITCLPTPSADDSRPPLSQRPLIARRSMPGRRPSGTCRRFADLSTGPGGPRPAGEWLRRAGPRGWAPARTVQLHIVGTLQLVVGEGFSGPLLRDREIRAHPPAAFPGRRIPGRHRQLIPLAFPPYLLGRSLIRLGQATTACAFMASVGPDAC